MHLRVLVRAGLVAAALSVAALTALPARAQDEPAPPPETTPRPATLSLTGSAEMFAKPDRATITSGVVTQAATAREALDANNEAIAEVIASLREAEISQDDIQTSGFNVQPRYQYPERQEDGSQEPPRIVGYEVSNQVTVIVRDLNALGGVLDRAVTVGANRIDGIAFEVSNADELLDDARADAIADARRKANVYSVAAGVRLERILRISESGGFEPPQPMYARAMRAEAADSVPVAPGTQRLQVDVQVTWEIASDR